MLRPTLATLVVVLIAVATAPALSQRGSRRPLSPADVDAITELVKLEDTRRLYSCRSAAIGLIAVARRAGT